MQLDKFYRGDARHMEAIPSDSIHLVVCSPPYNVGKRYHGYADNLPLAQYLDFLQAVWQECKRVLVPGGRLAINVANVGRTPYVPLNAHITLQLVDLGFLLRGDIIWDKSGSAGVSTAWGSFASATNPVLRDVHEYIILGSKETYAHATRGVSTIEGPQFVEASKSVWRFNTTQDPEHPCVFPVELPLGVIEMFTFAGDIVLDPFMGSGTTALAARRAGRHFIGYEQSRKYVLQAQRRLSKEKNHASANQKKVRDPARRG